MNAVGNNGRMTIEGDKIVISRKGTGLLTAINLGLQGDKIISLAQVTAVELRLPSFLTVGYLRLSINGRDPLGGVNEAIQDENAVIFAGGAAAAFEVLAQEIRDRMGPKASGGSVSLAEELEKLAGLRDRGIISEAEFADGKRKLLTS